MIEFDKKINFLVEVLYLQCYLGENCIGRCAPIKPLKIVLLNTEKLLKLLIVGIPTCG